MATFFAVTAGGNWNASTTWASSSGGAGGAGTPTASDEVILDSNSGNVTISASGAVCRSLDCTAGTGNYAGTLNLNGFACTIGTSTVNPSNVALKLVAGMTLTTANGAFNFSSSSTTVVNVTTAGFTMGSSASTTNFNNGGRYSLADNFLTLGAISIASALTQFTATANVTCLSFTTGNNTFVINLGSGIWTITENAAATGWNIGGPAVTINAGTSTIIFTNNNGNATLPITFAGGGFSYNNLKFNVAERFNITGANHFNSLTAFPGAIITMPASTTTVLSSAPPSGQANGYLRFPASSTVGTVKGTVTTPDNAVLDITGNITLEASIAPLSWTPNANTEIFAKWHFLTLDAYEWWIDTAGKLNFNVSTTGSNNFQYTSTVATGFSANQKMWVRASFTTGNPAQCQFFTSADGVTWSQLGSTISANNIPSIFNSSVELEIGSRAVGTAQAFVGAFYRARIYNSALGSGSGTAVFDADFTVDRMNMAVGATGGYQDAAKTQFLDSASGLTITLGGIMQAGDGRVLLNSSTGGTQSTVSVTSGIMACNYLSLQDSNATGGATFYAGWASANVSGNSGWIFTGQPTGGFFNFM